MLQHLRQQLYQPSHTLMEALSRLLNQNRSRRTGQTEPLLPNSSPSALQTHTSDANHDVGRAHPTARPVPGRRARASKMVWWFGCCGGAKRPSRSKRERKHRRSRRERKHHLSGASRGAAGAHPEVYAPALSVTSVASGVFCTLQHSARPAPRVCDETNRCVPQTLSTMMPGMPGQWVTQVRCFRDTQRVIPL